jgi:hypothetical protein
MTILDGWRVAPTINKEDKSHGGHTARTFLQ